ncbi:uncharacterized protein C1orf131 homolog isoform X2 [Lampris incognitus]|uniref:uncharacterized protein C1orf131 homolog isoform X2 n=1 Tax=Lampris incognitus TaxID=2546036 RepID=UPI0024B4BB81|nr:uncharacterized protein C1orf131 homolog isoform X2 [Lampris incognitus]
MSRNTNSNEDDGVFFLDEVLKKLYEFENGAASGNKIKSQKKKKRKRCQEEEELVTAEDVCGNSKEPRAERGDSRHHQENAKTVSPAAKQTSPPIQPKPQVEVVVFQDPTKMNRIKQAPASDVNSPLQLKAKGKANTEHPEDFTLEKARLEVHRFGITGYKKEQQRVFEQDRAIMLGANAPKKEYVNYRVLQQTIKEKKDKVKVEVEPDLKNKKKQSKPRAKKKASSGSGSTSSAQMGRFKDGMLILSSKEIQKIKRSRK